MAPKQIGGTIIWVKVADRHPEMPADREYIETLCYWSHKPNTVRSDTRNTAQGTIAIRTYGKGSWHTVAPPEYWADLQQLADLIEAPASDVGRFCDQCGIETSDANPVMPFESEAHDAWGDPQPPEITYLCVGCVTYNQAEADEIPY